MSEDSVGGEAEYYEQVRKLFALNFCCLYRMFDGNRSDGKMIGEFELLQKIYVYHQDE